MIDERVSRIPLGTFAIPFGLAGLADVWTLAGTAWGLPGGIADTFWVATAIAWMWLVAAHAVRGSRSETSLIDQLRNPAQGPIAALMPIVGMLLGARIALFAPVVGSALIILFIAIAALFAAWLICTWMNGSLSALSIHGGYFLPTVAGGLIASIAASEAGMTALAIATFAVGAFFWVIMTPIILARLMFVPPLPAPLVPTMAIFVAPPAVGGIAWFIMYPTVGPVPYALAALTIVMLFVQLALLPRYRRLSFTLGFWSFTFPFAAVGAYAVQWLALLRPVGWAFIVLAMTGAVSALVVAIAAKSIAPVVADVNASVRARARWWTPNPGEEQS